MSEYLIGAGAVLTAGPESSIARATLHTQTDPQLAATVEAAVIDFEASLPSELSRIVIVAAGWGSSRFEAEVIRSLLTRRQCTLVGVREVLREATGASEIHLFARWLPLPEMLAELAAANVRLLTHPLESIEQAALISASDFRAGTRLFEPLSRPATSGFSRLQG
jgi:hypothetical protein